MGGRLIETISTCKQCSNHSFTITERNDYQFIFKCTECEWEDEIVSLVDIQFLCSEEKKK
jgi:hypothetical protein